MGKNFFVLPVKDEEEAYETGNLIDFAYFKENYKLIALNLRKQTKLKILNESILLENLETKSTEQQRFPSSKNQKKQLLVFYKTL